MKFNRCGLDIAKQVFQVHGVNEHGVVKARKTLPRAKVLGFFAQLPPCLIGIEACGSAHYWARELTKLGHTVKLMATQFVVAYRKRGKNDANDAEAICEAVGRPNMRFVSIKSEEQQSVLMVHRGRTLAVGNRTAQVNQIRGLLKNLGLIIATARGQAFHARVQELVAGKPFLAVAVLPLLETRNEIVRQIATLDREVLMLARNDSQVRLFMTVPGIGPITALCYRATIDEPSRFKRSRSVGAYVGLTTRRYASGEVDWTGRISKCGDAMLRSYLFEAAGVLLTRVQKWCALKAWGMRLAKRVGLRKAKVAVARKLAVILHRMWIDGTEFQWSADKVVA